MRPASLRAQQAAREAVQSEAPFAVKYDDDARTGADFAFGQMSRFLDAGVRATMQRVTLGPDPVQALPPPRETATVDLRSLLRGRFG